MSEEYGRFIEVVEQPHPRWHWAPLIRQAYQAVATLRRHGLNARWLQGELSEWPEDGRQVARVG